VFLLSFLSSGQSLVAMRFQPTLASALVSSATLMGYVHAEDTEAASDATPVIIERPHFTVRLQENFPLVFPPRGLSVSMD
jgi:hypothetical protein